jgi:hypothetical protein
LKAKIRSKHADQMRHGYVALGKRLRSVLDLAILGLPISADFCQGGAFICAVSLIERQSIVAAVTFLL